MFEDDYKDSKINLTTWKKIFVVLSRLKSHIIKLIIFTVFIAALDSLFPFLNRIAIENFFDPSSVEEPFITMNLPGFIALYGVVIVAFGFCVWGFIREAGILGAEASYELRKEAFDNLQRLPFSYYDRTAHGWLMARMTSDSRRLADIISWGMLDILWSIASMIFIMIMMFIQDWRLALIVVASLPIMFLVSAFFSKVILKTQRKARKINSEVTAKYNEGFYGAKTTKSLNIEEDNLIEFSETVHSLRKSSIRSVIASSLFTSLLLVVCYVTVVIVLNTGGRMILSGKITTFSLIFMFVQYTMNFFDPVMSISRTFANFQQAQASAERIIGLIEEKPELIDTPEVLEKYGDVFNDKKENWESLKGDIEFDNVKFFYKENEIILDDFSLKIKAGQSVALVGHTGSGKTTIVNLISRFYEPREGKILLDGIDYKERSIHWLHSKLGYVLQTPFLFSATVMENIRYGRLTATNEEVINAAKVIGADEFIEKLEKKYDTNVGEGGNFLSIGQKQLISFARAILADPTILILDEATSSIDSEAEEVIKRATNELLKGRTSLIVAHRLSTIVDADLIIVLDMGKIIESGTHQELIDKRGHYFELYKNQFFKEKEEEYFQNL